MSYITKLRQATPFGFGSDIIPSKNLRQFSTRFAGTGSGCRVGTVTFSAGAITGIAVADGGALYSSNTCRVLISGNGTGATATATIVGGEITAFVVTAGGTGYTSANVYVVDGPVVVLVGDSISTEEPSPANYGASIWYGIKNAIQAENPKRNITFFNRAVGSQTWTTFNGAANSNLPAWYSNAAKDWIDYIGELKPDLVICAFGMNDKEDFVFSQMQAAITKLNAFAPEPDVILCTTAVPSAESSTESISGVEEQNGRDANSAYARGYAQKYGLGVLDFNRRSRLVRDGFDVRLCALRLVSSAVAALPWTGSEAAEGDFSIEASFSGVTAPWWVGNTITLYLGTPGSNTQTEMLISDNAGFLRFIVRDRQTTLGSVNQIDLTSTIATPTGTVLLGVVCQDSNLLVEVNGEQVINEPILRFAGKFSPYLTATTTSISPTITYCAGEYAKYAPRMKDGDIWGATDSDYKGNELNHPSSLGLAHVYMPVIYEADWAHNPVTVGMDSGNLTTNTGIGEPDPLARLHVTRLQMATETSPASDANNLLLEDADSVGMSLLTDDGGAARIKFGDTSNVSQFTIAYAHSSNLFTLTHGSTTICTFSASVAAFNIPPRVPSFTVATLPAEVGAGGLIFVTDASGGAVLAFADGSNWRRVTDRAVVS